LYGSYLIVDGDTVFGQRIDKIGFDETRFVNSHRDMSAMGSKYHKAYRNIANLLKFYITDNLGVTHISPNQTNNITLVAYDPKGNKTHLNFVLRISNGAMGEEYEPSKTNYLFPEDSLIQNGANWVVQTPSNTVYEPTKIVHSSNAHFCDASVEMHKAVAIKLKLENPTLPIEKYYVSVGSRALKTTYENGWLIAESKYAGAYSIKTDTQAPTIKGTSYNSSYIVKGSIVKLTITETQTELESYDLYIDGKWHLLEYEHKQDMLFFERPASLIGAHAVKIIAKDSCGNEVIYDRTLDFQ